MHNLPLSIHKSCAYNGDDYFHVRVILPTSVAKVLADAYENAASSYFSPRCAQINDLEVEFHDGEIISGELAWVCGYIDNTSFNTKPAVEGVVLDLSILKPVEGDERLDTFPDRPELPELFWLEPARIIRALLGAIVH